jgi:hypothetical protein
MLKTRNPDFIVLSSEEYLKYESGTDVSDLHIDATIEVFGDYFHSKKFTGMSRSAHQKDVIEYYKKAGIDCLVLWEENINRNPDGTKNKISKFLNSWLEQNLSCFDS